MKVCLRIIHSDVAIPFYSIISTDIKIIIIREEGGITFFSTFSGKATGR